MGNFSRKKNIAGISMKIHCGNLICSLFAFFFPPRKNAILFAARAIRVDIHAITFIRVAASMPDVTGSKNPIHLELAGASLAGDTWMPVAVLRRRAIESARFYALVTFVR